MKILKNLLPLKAIIPYLWTSHENVKRLVIFSLVFFLFTFMIDLSVPIVLKTLVSKLSSFETKGSIQVTWLLLAYGLIWTISQVIQQIRFMTIIRPLERSCRKFCSNLFYHIHSLPLKFHIENETGATTHAIERAQQGFPEVFLGFFLFVIPIVIEVILASCILCYFYGFSYGFVLFVVFFFYLVFTVFATAWASKYQLASNKHKMRTNAFIVDSLLNYLSVKQFSQKDHEAKKCKDLLEKKEVLLVKSVSIMEVVRIGQNIILGLGITVLMYMAGQQAAQGHYDISDFILINGYIFQFATPLSQMGLIARSIRKGLVDLNDVVEIYNKTTEDNSKINLPFSDKVQCIEFKNVNFGYCPSKLNLKDINLKLEFGKTIGIVGETGSGKSTIANLILKFFNPTSGMITINQMDMQNINSEDIRKIFGIVSQDITLFNRSIYENILFARPDASHKEVEKAIEMSCLLPTFETLPQHYNTQVGERGVKLSGGEKQKIAIARALLKKPQVYIFDEATSALDQCTEEKLMRNIATNLKNAMTIVIAHRLSAVVDMDEILVLQNGRIQERGTHELLLKKGEIYSSLWKSHENSKLIQLIA